MISEARARGEGVNAYTRAIGLSATMGNLGRRQKSDRLSPFYVPTALISRL